MSITRSQELDQHTFSQHISIWDVMVIVLTPIKFHPHMETELIFRRLTQQYPSTPLNDEDLCHR